jgi:D-3-phosphoglycerate dehydrogenase
VIIVKVLLCDPVVESVLQHFRSLDNCTVKEVFERGSLEREVPDANFLVVRSGTTVDRDLLDRGDELIGIVRAGVGLDNIDLEYADDQGVNVENTPEASTNAVAELVIAHLLSVFRSLPRADVTLKNGEWIKSDLDGREIQGKTTGVIGFGRIGRRVGRLVEAFGSDVVAHDEYIDDDTIREHGAEPVSLEELLERSDIVTVHVPLTKETRHMIGSTEIKTLNDDALLVNCSRGGIYDEEALHEALQKDEIIGVGLDTYEEEPPEDLPLLRDQSVVGTPHIGASTPEAQERIGQLVIDKIESTIRKSEKDHQ